MICTFFGHRDADERAENRLREVLVDLIENSNIVVTYVIYPFGGAAKYKAMAEKRGKTVINLAQPN